MTDDCITCMSVCNFNYFVAWKRGEPRKRVENLTKQRNTSLQSSWSHKFQVSSENRIMSDKIYKIYNDLYPSSRYNFSNFCQLYVLSASFGSSICSLPCAKWPEHCATSHLREYILHPDDNNYRILKVKRGKLMIIAGGNHVMSFNDIEHCGAS